MGAQYESIEVEGSLPREVVIVNIDGASSKRAHHVWAGLALVMTAVVACLLFVSSGDSPDELALSLSKNGEYTKEMLMQQLAAAHDGGAQCLEKQGLNHTEVKKFGEGTVCLGQKIQQNMGIGDTVTMIRDYLEAPMNHKDLMTCLHGVNDKIAKAVHTCLSSLPPAQSRSPVVEFWRKNTAQ